MDDQSNSIMNIPGQASANEGQYFDGRDARALIRALLTDAPLNGTPLEVTGPYRDIINVLHQAHAAGGTSSVHVAWNGIVRRHPELAVLVSGDTPSWPNHDTGAYACPEVLWRGRFADVATALGKRSWEIWAGTFAALAAGVARGMALAMGGLRLT
jgi:hypothetical protein